MASIRRFDAPVIKSIFTPETWDVHQGPVEYVDMGGGEMVDSAPRSPPMPIIGASGRMSKAISGDEYGRLMARLRRITPHTIREGTLASPFVEHRSSFPTASSDPFAYGGPVSIPGGPKFWGL
jgi:hypothetical protein